MAQLHGAPTPCPFESGCKLLRHQGRIPSLAIIMSYEESVLECADEYGCLTLKDAKRLFNEHGSDYWAAHNEGMPITLNAENI